MSQPVTFRPAPVSILQAAPSALRADIYQADDREQAGNSVLAQVQQQAAMADEKTAGILSSSIWNDHGALADTPENNQQRAEIPETMENHPETLHSNAVNGHEGAYPAGPSFNAHNGRDGDISNAHSLQNATLSSNGPGFSGTSSSGSSSSSSSGGANTTNNYYEGDTVTNTMTTNTVNNTTNNETNNYSVTNSWVNNTENNTTNNSTVNNNYGGNTLNNTTILTHVVNTVNTTINDIFHGGDHHGNHGGGHHGGDSNEGGEHCDDQSGHEPLCDILTPVLANVESLVNNVTTNVTQIINTGKTLLGGILHGDDGGHGNGGGHCDTNLVADLLHGLPPIIHDMGTVVVPVVEQLPQGIPPAVAVVTEVVQTLPPTLENTVGHVSHTVTPLMTGLVNHTISTVHDLVTGTVATDGSTVDHTVALIEPANHYVGDIIASTVDHLLPQDGISLDLHAAVNLGADAGIHTLVDTASNFTGADTNNAAHASGSALANVVTNGHADALAPDHLLSVTIDGATALDGSANAAANAIAQASHAVDVAAHGDLSSTSQDLVNTAGDMVNGATGAVQEALNNLTSLHGGEAAVDASHSWLTAIDHGSHTGDNSGVLGGALAPADVALGGAVSHAVHTPHLLG